MASNPPELPAGCIDSPAAGAQAAASRVAVAGWALDAAGPIDTVIVLVNDRLSSAARCGLPRPDLTASYAGVEHASTAGWQAVVDLRSLPGTEATLSVLARLSSGQWRELARSRVHVATGTSGRRPRAIFTIVQNERVFLPLWLGYYSRYFEPSDIWVLDHDGSDGSTDAIRDRCNVVPTHRSRSFDHAWLKSTVEEFQAFLLCSYEAVLFAEADELVIADPEHHDGLAAYIDGMQAPAACCTGFNVLHQPDEPALRFDQPILRQRRWWQPSAAYSKRLLARVPLSWDLGFHLETNVPDALPDPHLLLVHLHRVDLEVCLARHRATASRAWNDDDVRSRHGYQNRLGEAELREWFYRGPDLAGSAPEVIPARFRDVV